MVEIKLKSDYFKVYIFKILNVLNFKRLPNCVVAIYKVVKILHMLFSFLFRNGPSHYGSGRNSSIGGGSWKEAPMSPAAGANTASTSGLGGSGLASDLSSSVKSSSVYLNSERGSNASPMSTCSSTSSKRLNGHASSSVRSGLRASTGSSGSKLNSVSASSRVEQSSRSSRRRSPRSSESGSDSSGSESGSNSRSSSSSSSGSSSTSDNSRSTANSQQRKRQPLPNNRKQAQNSVSSVTSASNLPAEKGGSNQTVTASTGAQGNARPVAFEDKTNCAICLRNLPHRGNGPSGKSRWPLQNRTRFSYTRSIISANRLLMSHNMKKRGSFVYNASSHTYTHDVI